MIGWQVRLFDPDIFCGQSVLMDLVSISLNLIRIGMWLDVIHVRLIFPTRRCARYVTFDLPHADHIFNGPGSYLCGSILN